MVVVEVVVAVAVVAEVVLVGGVGVGVGVGVVGVVVAMVVAVEVLCFISAGQDSHPSLCTPPEPFQPSRGHKPCHQDRTSAGRARVLSITMICGIPYEHV